MKLTITLPDKEVKDIKRILKKNKYSPEFYVLRIAFGDKIIQAIKGTKIK